MCYALCTTSLIKTHKLRNLISPAACIVCHVFDRDALIKKFGLSCSMRCRNKLIGNCCCISVVQFCWHHIFQSPAATITRTGGWPLTTSTESYALHFVPIKSQSDCWYAGSTGQPNHITACCADEQDAFVKRAYSKSMKQA